MVRSFKEVYAPTAHCRLKVTGNFKFFPRHPADKEGSYRALDLTKNKESMIGLVSVSPTRVPPVSVIAECLSKVDRFYNHRLSGSEAVHTAARWAMSEAITASGPSVVMSLPCLRPPDAHHRIFGVFCFSKKGWVGHVASPLGCYGFLRRLWRNNKRSRNRVLQQLKDLCKRKSATGHGGYEFPNLSGSSSDPEDLSEALSSDEDEIASPDVKRMEESGTASSTCCNWITLLPKAR